MVYAITAALGGDSISVDLTVTTLPANTSATITAVHAYGSYIVRATLPTGATGSVTVKDRYPPFGTPITYQVRAYSASPTVQADSAPITVTITNALLTDTGTGNTIVVVVEDGSQRSYRARSTYYDVIGRRAPIVATQPARLAEGTLVLRCGDISTRNYVRDMLTGGYPLLLRTPSPLAVEDVTFIPTDWEHDQNSPAAGPYRWSVRYQAVSVETTPFYANSVTYASLAVDPRSSTYAGLTAVWATYAILALG